MSQFRHQLVRHSIEALLRLPKPARQALAGPAPRTDGVALDENAHLLSWLARKMPLQPGIAGVAPQRREMELMAPAVSGQPPSGVGREDTTLAGRHARIYRPQGGGRGVPAIVYFHGGGWVIGSVGTHDVLCCKLSQRTGCVVISVDYRLAPEHRFPAARDDALHSFREAQRRAGELSIDPERIAVGGDSAGGNLAAVVAQQTRADAPPWAQVLLYPVTDVSREHDSYMRHASTLLSRSRMRWFRDMYLGPGQLSSDPGASPLCHEDLSGLAPAVVVTAGFDPLCDEGRAYAARLAQAGNPVEALHFAHLVHGFASMELLGAQVTDAVLELTQCIKQMLWREPARRASA